MQRLNFVNLTNGVEWIADLSDFAFIRIESTAIEKHDWTRVLRDLDANLLMNLALGVTCHVYDCGSGREISKTISDGIPYIRSYLTDVWINGLKVDALTLREQEVKRKLNYFRRFLRTDVIHLFGHSKMTEHDGDVDFYRNILQNLL